MASSRGAPTSPWLPPADVTARFQLKRCWTWNRWNSNREICRLCWPQWWVCAVAEPDPAWECAVADDDGADDGDDDGDGVPFDVAADAMPAPPAPRPAAITPVTKSRRATP